MSDNLITVCDLRMGLDFAIYMDVTYRYNVSSESKTSWKKPAIVHPLCAISKKAVSLYKMQGERGFEKIQVQNVS